MVSSLLMIRIALFEPEIPANTGNIIRLCSALGCSLDLIHPLGFELEDKKLRRAGLDYHDLTQICHHQDFISYQQSRPKPHRVIALSTKGHVGLWECSFQPGDQLLFGPETRGLPDKVRGSADVVIRIPMHPQARSLNLSNSVAIVAYEAWRQLSLNPSPCPTEEG